MENLPDEPAPNLKINLLNSNGEPLIGGADDQNEPAEGAEVKYYSGAWRNFGVTQNGEISKEILPKDLTFRVNYNGEQLDKKQNTGLNNVIEFNFSGE